MYIAGVPIVEYEFRDVYHWCAHCRMCARVCFLCDHMPNIDPHNMFRKRVSSFALPFNLWAHHLCLSFLLFCRSCPVELALEGIGGMPPCMLCPGGTLILMMRLLTPLGMMIPSRDSFML